MKNCFLLFFLLFLIACEAPPAEQIDFEGDDVPEEDYEQIMEVAGYDVSHLDLYEDDTWDLPIPKMGVSHVLWIATLRCDTALLRQTLADGANPDIEMEGFTALQEAINCDNGLDLVKLLLAAGATTYGDLAGTEDLLHVPTIHSALLYGNLEVAEYLLANGSTIDDRDDQYGLGCAGIHAVRDSASLAFVLERGGNLEERCNSDRTLLHNAVLNNKYEFVEYLLKNKLVDPDVRDLDGDTAYDYAVIYEDQEMMDLLEVYLL